MGKKRGFEIVEILLNASRWADSRQRSIMSNNQLQTCDMAIKILRGCPYDNPYHAIRLKYADQIELQSLVGNP